MATSRSAWAPGRVLRRLLGWVGSHGRFPVLVLGAALASLVWLLVVTSTVTSPGRARAERAAPTLPIPAATLTEQTLRQVAWHSCRRQVHRVEVVAPSPPVGERSVVTEVAAAGTKVRTGTVLARVSGRPLIAVVTDAPLYRDQRLGDIGPDVQGLEEALAAAGLIERADGVMDATTLAAWRRLDPTGPDDRVRLDSIVEVPAGARVGEVPVSVGDRARPGSTVMDVDSGGDTFTCRARGLPNGLTAKELMFRAGGTSIPVASVQQRPGRNRGPGVLQIRPAHPVTVRSARVAVVSADSGGPVLAAPLSAIRIAANGNASVVVVDPGSGADPDEETTHEVGVTLGVTAQGLVAVTGKGLRAGVQVELFDPNRAPSADQLAHR